MPFKPLLITILCAVPMAVYAQGGPPLLTDDPGTPGPRHWEFNFAWTFDHVRGETQNELPLVDINYGVGDHFQLKVEMPWVVIRGATSTRGLGNGGVGLKARFLDQGAVGIDVSTYPALELGAFKSSVAKGVGEERATFLLPVEVMHQWQRFGLNGEVGYRFGPADLRETIYGIAAGFTASEKVELLAEWNGAGQNRFRDHGAMLGVGSRVSLKHDLTLLVSAAFGVAGSAQDRPDTHGYLGVQYSR